MCVTDFSLLYSLSKKTKFQIKKKGNIGARESKLEIQGFWKPSSSALVLKQWKLYFSHLYILFP